MHITLVINKLYLAFRKTSILQAWSSLWSSIPNSL